MQNGRISFRIPPDDDAALGVLAAQRHCTKSDIIRQLVHQGLDREGTKDSIDFIRDNLHDEIESYCKPQFERLAKLEAKIGYQSVSNFYLLCYIMDRILPPSMSVEFEEIKRKSKMMAIAYLKLRDDEFAEFMRSEDKALDLLDLRKEEHNEKE